MIGDKQPIIAELWVVYGYYFLFLPIYTRPISLTHFAGSPYTACIMSTIIGLYNYMSDFVFNVTI